ncbi:MAG TPA: acetyl-CoA carboxylase, carboxyltransferase subunit beta [Streptosporangiaceae bacterium]|nr:acetyl-CoA carboxylase, carboxyltransferase subunit beta [Streptosporangiaceae bacterium]
MTSTAALPQRDTQAAVPPVPGGHGVAALDVAPWILCHDCRMIVYGKRLARNWQVCPHCGHHRQLTAHERVALLFDEGSVAEFETPRVSVDPLGFSDVRPYTQRLHEARERTGLREAVVCVRGRIEGNLLVAAVMDFRFLGGSLGTGVGEAITRCAEIALADRVPLLVVSASGGARMQEGALSLMQMAKTSQAIAMLDEAGILTLSLVTDPTYGGVAASYATLCDVIIAEPGARLGFAGPRVVMQTIRQNLPAGFQTAEYLLKHGLIDMVRPRAALRHTLGRLLALGSGPRRCAAAPASDPCAGDDLARGEHAPAVPDTVITDPGQLPERDPWETVRLARDLARPGTLDYVAHMCEEFEELRGDRQGGDCPAIVGGLARVGGTPIVLIGHQKGHNAAELTARNFGMALPSGYRKAARLMRLAAKLGIPVVTLIDTPGAFPGVSAEEQGQSAAIAENLRLMASLPVPVVTVITGEGGSGGALALAVADRVYIHADATYSVISPEGCAAILWKDSSAARLAAASLGVGARDLLRLGVVDGVVPAAGSRDAATVASQVRQVVCQALDGLTRLPSRELLASRRARFRRYGVMTDAEGAAGVPVATGAAS